MGTIADKLLYLDGTKTALREAINLAGGNVADDAPFRQYANWVRKQSASLSLDFVREEYIARNATDNKLDRFGFGNIITFTRASGGGRFNSAGVYEWVGDNVPRLDYGYDVVTPARTNLLLRSSEFDNAAWQTNVGTCTVTPNSVMAPDGSMSADSLSYSSVDVNRFQVLTVVSGQTYTFSVWLKVPTGTATVRIGGLATGVIVPVNLTTEWQRVTVTQTVTATSRYPTITANGAQVVHAWGAQVETGTVATDYIPTEASAVTVPATLEFKPRGILIEEQRTNLLTYSEQINSTKYDTVQYITVTSSVAVSPDGTVSAGLVAPTVATGAHYIYRLGATFSYVSGTTYTYTVFAKFAGAQYLQLTMPATAFGSSQYANFDLLGGVITTAAGCSASIVPSGNGWYRCSVSVTATASAAAPAGATIVMINTATSGRTPAFTGVPTEGVYLWGAQLEAGAFPTSYIPTVASQVTRSEDVASVNTLSPWYNATEGTLFARGSKPSASSAGLFFDAGLAGSSSERLYGGLTNANSNSFTGDWRVAGSSPDFFNNTTPKWAVGKVSAIALSYGVGRGAACDGVTVRDRTTATIPTVAKLQIGKAAETSSAGHLNGHIQSLEYYPRRLSNTELQEITA